MRRTVSAVIGGLLLAGAATAIGLLAQAPKGAAANPLIGTWKFNPQKSKMNLNLPPRDLTRTYEDGGDGVYIFTQTGHLADNTKAESLYVAKDDGRNYPLVIAGAENLPAAYISVKRIDAYTAEQTEKVNGSSEFGQAPITTAIRKISADGKTMTLTVKALVLAPGQDDRGVLPAGSNEVDIMVFEKQ